jgi:hypothetical protein
MNGDIQKIELALVNNMENQKKKADEFLGFRFIGFVKTKIYEKL